METIPSTERWLQQHKYQKPMFKMYYVNTVIEGNYQINKQRKIPEMVG